MRRKRLLLFCTILLCFASYGYAQPWSGIVAANRATANWSMAGVEGGIPSGTWTQCGSTIAAYNGSGSTIQNAINSCAPGTLPGNGKYVQLGAGTFTLSSGFSLKRGVVVRGMGADKTTLIINGATVGNGCGFGDMNAAIAICAGSVPQTKGVSWTGGYSQGSTQVTLGATGLPTDTMLMFGQANESDNWPSAGYSLSCGVASSTCSNQGYGGEAAGLEGVGYGGFHLARVTGSCGSGCYNITPPIGPNNFRSGQSPKVSYANSTSAVIAWTGVEDLSVDYSHGPSVGIAAGNAMNIWIKGTRTVYNCSSGCSTNYNIWLLNTLFATVNSNYVYNQYYQVVNSYPIRVEGIGSVLIENNICQGPSCDVIVDGQMANSVTAYNFYPGLHGPGEFLHGAAQMFNLFEGNVTMGFGSDVDHGTSESNTLFRNAMIGRKYGPTEVAVGSSVYLLAHNRLYNVIGNVMGDTHYTSYEDSSGSSDCNSNAIYCLNSPGNTSGTPQSADGRVKATLMRWGNWDSVTNATHWNASEVPSTLSSFANPVPASQTLPASFYLNGRPSWWGNTIPWPAIGPDVDTSGASSSITIANMGNHAHLNPAANCYLNVMHGATNGSGGPLTFNAATCYASTSTPAPPPPTGLKVVAQ